MFDWFTELRSEERHTILAAFGGWAVDAFDFMVYTFVIPTLIVAWGMSRGEAGFIGTVTLILSAVGGWLAGILSDRYGRVRMLQVSIGWFALFTFLCGFTTSPDQLLVTRALQGLGFGGEWAVGSVLVGEMVRAQHRGKAVGTVQSGWAIGWGVAALAFTVLFMILPEDWAWRALFWMGLLPALLIFYVRRNVKEPEVFLKTRSHVQERGGHFLEIFGPQLLRTTVLSSLMTLGMMIGYYAVTFWLPTYLKTVRHLSVLNTGVYTTVIIVGSFVGFVTAAYLADRIGRRNTFFLFAVCSSVIAVAYTQLPLDDAMMLVLGFPLGFFISGNFSGVGAYLTELLPSRVRGSGQGFIYNVGRGLSAFTPFLVGRLSETIGLGQAIAVVAGTAFGTVILMVALLPETRGKELAAYD
ncbi:MAG: MFS transporter [Betaproteobacteria bacterium]|nr:MFS transporter [Betaproteobacteria bacterium]